MELGTGASFAFPVGRTQIILEAIDALEDEIVSNESAILGYIKGKYGACNIAFLVRSHLARMVCAGEVVLNLQNNNYHRPAPVKIRGRRRRRKRKVPPPEPFTGAPVTPSEAFVLGDIDAISAKASQGSSSPSLPSYPEMIVEALQALDNENGSNSATIAGYLEGKYGTRLSGRHAIFVRGRLSLMKARGQVISKGVASSGP